MPPPERPAANTPPESPATPKGDTDPHAAANKLRNEAGMARRPDASINPEPTIDEFLTSIGFDAESLSNPLVRAVAAKPYLRSLPPGLQRNGFEALIFYIKSQQDKEEARIGHSLSEQERQEFWERVIAKMRPAQISMITVMHHRGIYGEIRFVPRPQSIEPALGIGPELNGKGATNVSGITLKEVRKWDEFITREGWGNLFSVNHSMNNMLSRPEQEDGDVRAPGTNPDRSGGGGNILGIAAGAATLGDLIIGSMRSSAKTEPTNAEVE